MARLYYEKKLQSAQMVENVEQPRNVNEYLDKIARVVPGEIIAGYLTMIGLLDSINNVQTQIIFTWIIFVLSLILTPVYLNKVAEAGKPKRNHLILSTIGFVVWAYVISGKQLLGTVFTDLYEPAIASIILVAFSLISAVIPLNK